MTNVGFPEKERSTVPSEIRNMNVSENGLTLSFYSSTVRVTNAMMDIINATSFKFSSC